MKIFSVLARLCILCGYGIYSFRFDSDTEKILCTNQCNAFCLESQYSCSIDFLECSTGNESTKSYWMANCDFDGQHPNLNKIPHCIGTCNTLREHFDYSRAPEIPEVTLNDVTGTHVDLSWPPSNSVFIVYYVVQMREMGNSSWTTVISKARLTRFKISVPDPCGQYDFRVMAINEYGSKGFSSHVRVSKFVPGPVPNITYAEQGMHYKPGQSAFMGIIQWSNIPGWTDSDIQSYYWNPNPQRNCKSLYQSVQPLFRDASQGKNQVLMEFDEDAFGCSYETQVRAISRCGVTGIWTNFTVDLSDCRFLHKFPCQLYPHEFSPPGKVQNVSIGADRGGRKVMIKLQWLPPDDLGSMGMVDHYFIRWGQVQIIRGINLPSFTSEPNITKVPWDTVEFYVQVERNVHADYGFQIIPVAPNHPLSDNEWGLFTIHVIEVSPAGKSHSNRLGTVLLDDSEVRVMKINNTVDVSWTIVQSRDLRRNKSMFYDRYAVQWGKVEPGKTSNDSRLVAEKNSTIVPSSNAKLTIPLNKTGIFYGIQIKGLKENDTVEEEVWDTVPLHIFQIPDPGGGNSSGSSHTEYLQPDDDSNVLQIVLPILSVILLVSIIVTAKYKCRNQWKKFNYLEERREMPGGISNDYNNVHRGSIFSLHPVEPDRWEVPHSSVKVGKILGCGAFGQVVKGRISKSVLLHRGVHIPNGTRTGSTYVSVAVKMLQEEALDSYKEDFLREINLMKTIGFHPHVVNMLGCCTLNDPICLIVEHVPYGDMLSHLKKIRQKIQHRDSTDGHYVNRDIDILSPIDLLSFARQIAIGMEFLSQKGFVHRDLAARNILVGYNKTVKIGDFGLTRYIYNDSIYINRKGGRLPLKWMSIEAIFELTFSTASDVWSFGVVLFEIVTLGGTPYPTLDPRDLLKELKQGYRMEKPDNCSDQLYQVMLQCWEELPDKRPSFTNLRDILDDMLEETSGVEYLHFRLDDNKNYYHVETEDSAENENIEMDDADSCDMTADDRFENEACQSAIENIANGQVKRTRFSDVTIYISDEYETDTEDEILGGGEEESDSILSDKSSDNVEKDTGLRDNDHNDVPLDKDEKAERENCLACSLSNDSNVKDYFVSDNHAENRDLTKSSENRIPRRNSSSGSLCISNSHCIDKEMANNSEGSDESTISDMIASDAPKACESIDTCVKDRSLVLRTSSSSSGYDDDVFVDDDKTLPLVCQRFPKISNLPFYFRRGYAPDSLGYGSGSSHTSSDVDSNQSQSLV